MLPEKVNEILNFAIEEEEKAYRFYTDLAARMDKPYMKAIFEEFAREEQGHKAKLLHIKQGEGFEPSEKKVLDLKLADYLVDVKPDADLDYQEALILAMKKEKAAFKLYTDLAQAATDENLAKTLMALAQEEAKHKLRFEIEYDNVFLRDN